MTEQTPAVSEERGYRKALRGIVVSDKMDKTCLLYTTTIPRDPDPYLV